MMRLSFSWGAAAAVSLALLVGGGFGSAWAAFSATTSNGVNSFSAASVTSAPTIARATVSRPVGGGDGTVRQGGDYYVYAQATDDVGVTAVRADTSSFDSGITAASLSSTGGPWTVGGQTYNHRSAVLGADTPLKVGSAYAYSVSASDAAGNTATSNHSATVETYAGVVGSTAGLLSYWRLDDGAIFSDEYSGAAGTLLENHTGATGSWTSGAGQARRGVITTENRLRKETGSGGALYYASGAPSSANYAVEADVHVKSLMAADAIGIVGRMNTAATSDTFYLARYWRDTTDWDLFKIVNGTATKLGFYDQPLTAGQTYRLTLDMSGSTIRLLVDGVQRVSVTDTGITAPGRGGVRLGTSATGANVTDTAGLHLDNFRITSSTTTAADSKGTNNGAYNGGARLNQPGALVGDHNRATFFDGIDDYTRVARQIQDDFSIEFWFKSTQGLNTNSQWWGNAGLVDAEVGGAAGDFGTSLRSDGRVTAGTGGPDTSILSPTALNNGQWQHLVFTRTRSTGALTLYINGDLAGSATGSTTSLASSASIDFARIQSGVNYYAGSIDEVAVYNVQLSAATALDHFKAGRGTG